MDDNDIEQLLNRYAPAGPPPRLRARIVRPETAVRIWPWAAAASVLLVATVALQVATKRTAAHLDIARAPDSTRLAIDDLAEILGGDDVARRYAEAAIFRVRANAASSPVVRPSVDEGSEAP